ncbi:MAG: hypothetical protein LM573_04385 [Thermofilum sp.]|nr:hypothetical protein [Thermofilum sp.]
MSQSQRASQRSQTLIDNFSPLVILVLATVSEILPLRTPRDESVMRTLSTEGTSVASALTASMFSGTTTLSWWTRARATFFFND